ncbi:DUF4166 domain-containing protein [Mucilaginibacter agri]|uniref:DUF4166 domain-containing protein n=1 Tax=Mucilaginibacter agri TaxID=2695265 RepID=A0A966DSR9_9SPHI|nr:DUF4166 domain-containing protein [Mucilaginibacter agri]NCD69895.1 DUF4166 domain-containing protein [Mucilaginibacter agri]
MNHNTKLKWAKFILFIAGIYNIFWGSIISLFPQVILFGNPSTDFLLIILRCVGMLVGVYGIAYYFASRNPNKYWPLILVGFIGKVLGPIGSVYYIVSGTLTPSFFIVNIFNDIIWLYPFGWVIYQAITQQYDSKVTFDNPKPLYQKFLGEAYDNLSPNLKQFHQSKGRMKAQGTFKVTRGNNFMGKIFANIADLPYNSDSAEAELIVDPLSHTEIWSRRLGDKKVVSKQWLSEGLLVERFKIVNIYLLARVTTVGDLIIYDAAATIMGIAMPPFFTPTVYATGKDVGDSVLIDVEISFKPFGRIINYNGLVKVSTDV